MLEFLSLIPSYSHVNVSRALYSNLAQGQRGAGSRFRRAIAPSTPTPRNLPRPLWPVAASRVSNRENPRLEFLASPTKQTIGAKSNRERIAFSSQDSAQKAFRLELRRQISNSNIRTIKNSPKCRRNNTYIFSNRNKTAHSGIFTGSSSAAGGVQMRPARSQQTVRQPSKSVRIRREMAVSPQALRTPSVDRPRFRRLC